MGRARGDQHLASAQSGPLSGQQALGRGGDLQRLRHAAGPEFRLRHRAVVGTDHVDAVIQQRREIAPRRRVLPHAHVHGGRDQDRQRGGEQNRGGEIVRVPARHPCHEVGGRGRDDDQVGIAGEPDMADIRLVLAGRTGPCGCVVPESAEAASGVTNCCAPAVRMQRTDAPRSRRRRMRSRDL